MARITASSVEEVRNRVNVYDLISGYVALKKSGSSYRGLSPFSAEKTPSFYVYPDKGFYYCFSTSQGGDIFKFVQVKENLTFPEAVEFIANRFSIKLEFESGGGTQTSSLRKQLYDIHEDAADWYAKQFFSDTPEAAEIRDYWVKDRGFTLDDARELRIGFAPSNSDGLKKILAAKKYAPNAISGSGIFNAREGETNLSNFYPRFRGRMTIPICDIQGRVIAFTARKTRFTPDIPSEEGKYVNSRDTDIFHKNHVVFNMDKAKNTAKDKNYCIVVEGQIDAIRMYCSGFKNAVATQGTAAGPEHFALIKRFADKAVLLFDGDRAGQHAALRVIPICFKAEVEPFVAVIPDGNDPDDYIKKHGAAAMRELVENKKRTALSFAARAVLEGNPNPTPQERLEAMKKLFEIIDNSPSRVLREDYLREVSTTFGVDYSALAQDYRRWSGSQKPSAGAVVESSDKNPETPPSGMLTNSVLDALFVALHYENIAEALSKIVRDEWMGANAVECRAFKRLMALHREGIGFDASRLSEFFEDDAEQNLIYKLQTAEKSSIESPVKYANECIKKIYKKHIEEEINSLNSELIKYDNNNLDEKLKVLKRISELRKESRTPPAEIQEK